MVFVTKDAVQINQLILDYRKIQQSKLVQNKSPMVKNKSPKSSKSPRTLARLKANRLKGCTGTRHQTGVTSLLGVESAVGGLGSSGADASSSTSQDWSQASTSYVTPCECLQPVFTDEV